LRDSQEKQRQELQPRQAAGHERAAKQPSASANVALDQQHQAQTQALAQRHTTEQRTLQETQQTKPEGKVAAAPHT
jgi:hypothetical protein